MQKPRPRKARPNIATSAKIIELQNNCCLYCGMAFGDTFLKKHKNKPPTLKFVKLEMDHVEPYSYGQNNQTYNFVAACQTCNGIKSDKHFDTLADAIIYVRDNRTRKGLPLCKLPNSVPEKKKVAEVLLCKVQERLLLEAPCNSLTTAQLENHIATVQEALRLLTVVRRHTS